MSDLNKLHRFRRLRVDDDWPQCCICREPVNTGFDLYYHDTRDFGVDIITSCDSCPQKARSNDIGWIEEVSK